MHSFSHEELRVTEVLSDFVEHPWHSLRAFFGARFASPLVRRMRRIHFSRLPARAPSDVMIGCY
jgi:uncharacterized protein YprB with RNaseH-like and TPR domain